MKLPQPSIRRPKAMLMLLMQEVSLFKFLTTGHANQTMQFTPRALSLVLLKSVSVQILGSDLKMLLD
jgi:hypothetical protein